MRACVAIGFLLALLSSAVFAQPTSAPTEVVAVCVVGDLVPTLSDFELEGDWVKLWLGYPLESPAYEMHLYGWEYLVPRGPETDRLRAEDFGGRLYLRSLGDDHWEMVTADQCPPLPPE